MDYITNNYKETEKLGKELAKKIKEKKIEPIIIGLKGNLGGGKTTFLKGFAKEFKVKEKVVSPTFVIFRKLKIAKSKGFLFHFDCYRIKNKKEIIELGFDEIVNNKENIIVIEWPEKIKSAMPKEAIFINFKFISENKRKITINNFLL